MCRKVLDTYRCLNPLLEKIETVSRLNPAIESDEELALVLGTLLSIVADYAQQAKRALNALMVTEASEGDPS